MTTDDSGVRALRTFCVMAAAVGILSVYVYFVLKGADIILGRAMVEYAPSGSYALGVGIFFAATLSLSAILQRARINGLRTYALLPLGLFFPLVFLSSLITTISGLPNSQRGFYIHAFCAAERPERMCGAAFAQMVFAMSLRALPAVLTAPLLYWLILFRLIPALERRRT